MKSHILLLFLLVMISFPSFGQEHKSLREGNAAYEGGDYTKAEEEYLRAIDANPKSVKGYYNRGNAIYKGLDKVSEADKKERLDVAAKSYLDAIGSAKNNKEKSDAYYNLGNTYMQQQDLKKGAEAYKNALRLNPKDMDAKTNLQYALKQMQMQQQQQNQQGEGEENQDQQQQQDQQNQDQKDQQNQQGQGKQGEEQEDKKDQQQNQDKSSSDDKNDSKDKDKKDQQGEQDPSSGNGEEDKQQPSPEEMSKEEVLRQLKVMDEAEKKVKEKLRKEQRSTYKSDKDW